MTHATLLQALNENGDLPHEFAVEIPMREAFILSARVSDRGYHCVYDSNDPHEMTTLRAKGQSVSSPLSYEAV